jgi:hypothetical protein
MVPPLPPLLQLLAVMPLRKRGGAGEGRRVLLLEAKGGMLRAVQEKIEVLLCLR